MTTDLHGCESDAVRRMSESAAGRELDDRVGLGFALRRIGVLFGHVVDQVRPGAA